MDKLDRIIEIIRTLKEEGMVVGAGGYTGAADPKGPAAGYDKYDKLIPGVPDGRTSLMRRLPLFYRTDLLGKKRKKKKK